MNYTPRWVSHTSRILSASSLSLHARRTAFVIVMGLLLLPFGVYAQNSTPLPSGEVAIPTAARLVVTPEVALPITSVAWRTNFGAQAAALLASRSEAGHSIMLQNVIYFATNYAADVDLSATMPALMRIYTRNPNEANRIMAAVAMSKIALHNNAFASQMNTLRKLVANERSARVRKHTLDVLVDYYAARGEELVLTPRLYVEYKRLKRRSQ